MKLLVTLTAPCDSRLCAIFFYVMLHSLLSVWLAATTLPGWYTSYLSLVTTSVTKRASALAKNGTEATKALQLKFITSWEVIKNFRLESYINDCYGLGYAKNEGK